MTRNNASSDNLNDVYRTLQRLQPSAQFRQDIGGVLSIRFTDQLSSGRQHFFSPVTFIPHQALYCFFFKFCCDRGILTDRNEMKLRRV